MAESQDIQVRRAAFDWLGEQVQLHDDVLPWKLIAEGFQFHGVRVPLVSQQGIFKPKVCEFPLSIRTSAKSPYTDHFVGDLLRYSYRGTDPFHRDNVGLREVMKRRRPLVYFHATAAGQYLAVWPVYVVSDDPKGLHFAVAVDDRRYAIAGLESAEDAKQLTDPASVEARRSYVTLTTRQRIHQRTFRERVLRAYRMQCAFCRLRHQELLDAAHIVPDKDPDGEPIVQNGLALCKLHHAAYDKMFLAVRPDFVVEVKPAILEEEDGPMLLHGLKGLNLTPIQLPKRPADRPDPARLERRYREFRAGF